MDRNEAFTALDDDSLYDTATSGAFLGFQPTTMRNARNKGTLAGVEPPAFIKMGSKVLYRGKILKDWRAQFVEKTRTNQTA